MTTETLLRIRYRNPTGVAAGVRSAALDGAPLPIEDGAALVPLPRDGGIHEIDVLLG